MTENEKVNVLLVDDQPAKLLTYEEILKGLDAKLVKATSAQEAFQFLLHDDVAVILVDVYMPDLDGFQLASMIRGHPRFEKTAIIFISAIYLSELDRLRGYESGAVDYVPVPVVPEILRAKVNVFIELYRKTRALERMNRELEHRVAERTSELEASNKRLQESEERLRLASEAAEFGTYDCRPPTGSFHCSAQTKQLLGREGDEDLDLDAFLGLVCEPDRAAVHRFFFSKHPDDGQHRVEFRVSHGDGTRWLLGCGRTFFEGEDCAIPARIMGTLLDLTERKQVEERQLLLMAELDHRVKNILANVGAIVKLSSKNTGSVPEFVEALDARIHAISKAHSALRRDSWIGIDLQTYLSELLAPFIAARGKNIILKGDAIDLSPKAAQSLALVFHELATNAVKYGALSVPGGRVTLSWKRRDVRDGAVKLTWREENGPTPAESGRRGFGTMVIDTVAAELGSKVKYDFCPQGVVFSIEGQIEGTSKAQSVVPMAPMSSAIGMNGTPTRQLRIFLVEDELLIGLHAKTELESNGHKVVALATNVSQGMDLAQDLDFDFALLDIRLGDEISVPVADKLCDRKMNFAFVTGFEDETILPAHLRSIPRFSKPYEINVILDYIASLPEVVASR
jgi:two-component sensor histidine kinase/DNA-binding response OmpR family regulator